MVFITVNALHVSGGSSTHHQELKTVYTAYGICQAFLLLTAMKFQLTHNSGKKQKKLNKYPMLYSNSPTIAVRSRKSSTNTRCSVYSFELLMMGGGTA
jgi:hypothetical protein